MRFCNRAEVSDFAGGKLIDGIQYSQFSGGNQSVERYCDTQPFGAFEANIKANINGPTTMQPYCEEGLEFSVANGFYMKKECTCYENNCNSAENESKLPKIPEKSVDCLAEFCQLGKPCVQANTDGVCKGQHCVVRKFSNQQNTAELSLWGGGNHVDCINLIL